MTTFSIHSKIVYKMRHVLLIIMSIPNLPKLFFVVIQVLSRQFQLRIYLYHIFEVTLTWKKQIWSNFNTDKVIYYICKTNLYWCLIKRTEVQPPMDYSLGILNNLSWIRFKTILIGVSCGCFCFWFGIGFGVILI